jgi:tRNA A-37 threonylcarbamoyl transferase component Bud32
MVDRVLYLAPDWPLRGNLDQILEQGRLKPIKQTARTLAGFIPWNGRCVFVKRVETRGYLQGLIARLVGSRAERTLRGSQTLEAGHFQQARPLLAAEQLRWGSVMATYVVTEALCGPLVLSQVAVGRRRDPVRRRQASREVAAEIRRLHDGGINTRDMQETNLLVDYRDGMHVLYFVDLEDFRPARRVSWQRRMINLVHLDRSIGRFASRAHRLRFLYDYLGAHPNRPEARRIVRYYQVTRTRIERRSAVRNRP